MTLSFKLILLHQLLFQGMFLAKNLYLRRKLGMAVRGGNREANMAVAFFVLFIGLSLWLAWRAPGPGTLNLISAEASLGFGLALMAASLVVALASLLGLRDSWRVGVLVEQHTELVQDGIYRFSRNPYFLSYLLLFAAYTVLLHNLLLALCSVPGIFLVHAMVVKEEHYLLGVHGEAYREYCRLVPRYLLR